MSFHITEEQLKSAVVQIESPTVLVTLTNYGYLMYTYNMLRSLAPFGIDRTVLVITIDRKSYEIMKKLGYHTICMEGTHDAFCPWNTKGYDEICFYKLQIIHQILSRNKNIVMIDGDIVFLQDPLPHIALWSTTADDVWIQNDGIDDKNTANLCTGYMMIRSTAAMIERFDCTTEQCKSNYAVCAFNNNDQTFFNTFVKPNCITKALPLALYPNGNIFYYMPTLQTNAILVHFNWAKGHEKLVKMKEHSMWLLTAEEEASVV
jgi:hypothetical protein